MAPPRHGLHLDEFAEVPIDASQIIWVAAANADVLDRMSEMAPREMRRAWMTAFGNAKLDRRSQVSTADLPDSQQRRTSMGFVQ